MSYLGLTVTTPAVVAMTAGSYKTALQITAPTNQALTVKGISGTCDGTNNTATPGILQLVAQSSAGTMSAATPVMSPIDAYSESIQSTSQYNASAEPTTGNVLWSQHVHPQWGKRFDWSYGVFIRVGGGKRVGLRGNFPAAVNMMCQIDYEE